MTILCPKCNTQLELPSNMVREIVQCSDCNVEFVASEWSGTLLTDEELARYRTDHEHEKIAERFRDYFSADDDKISRMVCGTLELATADFPIETISVCAEGEKYRMEYPYPGVYVIARIEKDRDKGVPTHSLELQRLIEAVVGYQVEDVYEDMCDGDGNTYRRYIHYFVHLDKQCERMILPDCSNPQPDRIEPKDRWTLIRDFEYHRARDLLYGNDVESIYSSRYVDYKERIKKQYGFRHIQVWDIDHDQKEISRPPDGVEVRVETAEGQVVLPEGLLAEISHWLDRKLTLVKVVNWCASNEYIYSVHRPVSSISKPKQKTETPSVPPDSFFSTGRKDEYRVGGITYIDISKKSDFWGGVISFWAALQGKSVIRKFDRIFGGWDEIKQAAMRR